MKSISGPVASLLLVCGARAAVAQEQMMLHTGWLIQSSAKVGVDGAAISSPTYHPADWYHATVPSTVVGAVANSPEWMASIMARVYSSFIRKPVP